MSQISDKMREECKRSDDLRDAGLQTPADIQRFDNIIYGEDPRWQSLDVYRPKDAEGRNLPVIVSVHGGGWVYGDKERYQFYCMDLAQRGFAVVNFSYRLAPENKFPSSLEDTNSVFRWVLTNADCYGFDSSHVFAVGDSAGAQILGLYANLCTNPVYAAKFDFRPPTGFAPKAIALNCGVYDPFANDPEHLTESLMAEYLPAGGTRAERDLIHVIRYITPDFPPVFTMTASGDFLKEQMPLLVKMLTEKEVPFFSHFYTSKTSSLGHVFHCDIRNPAAKSCNDEECAYFRRFL